MQRPRLPLLLALVLLGSAVGAVPIALSQDRQAGGRAPAPAPTSSDPGSDDATTAASAEERAEGDEKVKVFRFSGFDISGRLKSPQLLYFLNRLRAEFDRPHLPHRSFMPELDRSTKGKAL